MSATEVNSGPCRTWRSTAGLLSLALCLLSSCARGPADDVPVVAPPAAHAAAAPPTADEKPPVSAASGHAAQAEESWTAYYLSGAKVGYNCLRAEPVRDGDRDCIRFRYEDVLVLKRFQTATVVATTIDR